jgi:addiction module RelE/StbE family toxin
VRVLWRKRALDDIRRIVDFIAVDNPAAATRVAQELIVAGDSLKAFPRRGRLGRRPGWRELVVTSPYLIIYRIDPNDTVTILRVWHGAQDRP